MAAVTPDRPRLLALGAVTPRIEPSAWIAPGATVVGDVQMGADSSIWYGAVVRADREAVVIGERVNIQDLACIHADPGEPAVLEDGVSLGHQAVVHGARIEAGALVGIGAVVLGGAVVGAGALVAAGALVRAGQVIPPHSMAAGVPARVLRELTDEERATLRETSTAYVEASRTHALAREVTSSSHDGAAGADPTE